MTTATGSTDANSLLARDLPAGRSRILRGLYWHEWFSHGSQMLLILSIWLVGQWVLEVFLHPAWVIGWGTALGLWLAVSFAGSDAQEMTEEFSLALPPLRAQRYVARLVVSLTFLLMLVGISVVAIVLNWSQHLWGLLIETGFTRSFTPRDAPTYLYPLAVACPLGAYGVAFGFAAMAASRDQVALAALFGFGYTLAGSVVGASVEEWWFKGTQHTTTMGFVVVILMSMAGLLLMLGYNGYKRKDGVSRPRGTASPEWREALIFTGSLVLLMILAVVVVAYIDSGQVR